MLGKVTFKSQKAFVKGRQILDTFLIANEAINFMLKSNTCGIMCKLDTKKAYDYVNWSFLLSILEKINFG